MSDITLTAGELRAEFPALMELGNAKVPNAAASYALGKAVRKATPEFQAIEKARIALCEEHAIKDDAGKPVLRTMPDGREAFAMADQSAFDAALALLLAEPVTLTGVRTVTIAELAGVEVAPNVLGALEHFVLE